MITDGSFEPSVFLPPCRAARLRWTKEKAPRSPGPVLVDDPVGDRAVEALLKKERLLLRLVDVSCRDGRVEFLHAGLEMRLHRLVASLVRGILSESLLRRPGMRQTVLLSV
jgi:hypothetical protein